jgi:hypothetical protein
VLTLFNGGIILHLFNYIINIYEHNNIYRWNKYCYEANLSSRIARQITGNPTLEKKYVELNNIVN